MLKKHYNFRELNVSDELSENECWFMHSQQPICIREHDILLSQDNARVCIFARQKSGPASGDYRVQKILTKAFVKPKCALKKMQFDS